MGDFFQWLPDAIGDVGSWAGDRLGDVGNWLGRNIGGLIGAGGQIAANNQGQASADK